MRKLTFYLLFHAPWLRSTFKSKEYAIKDIPMVHLQNRTRYVSNPDGILYINRCHHYGQHPLRFRAKNRYTNISGSGNRHRREVIVLISPTGWDRKRA